jgi:hypothetical protein
LGDLSGRSGDLSGRLGDLSGRSGDLSGRLVDLSGRSVDLSGSSVELSGSLISGNGSFALCSGKDIDRLLVKASMSDGNGREDDSIGHVNANAKEKHKIKLLWFLIK